MSLLRWLFRTKPETVGVADLLQDVLDRIKAVERGLKRAEGDVQDLKDDLAKRLGRVWARLKTLQNDEPAGEEPEQPPARAVPPIGSHAHLEALRARRRQSGLLSR